MNLNFSCLERVAKHASSIGLVFFIGAIWFEFLYYGSFGIDIFTYLSFAEIITLFIGHIPFLLLLALLVLLYILFLTQVFEKTIIRLTITSKTRRDQRGRISQKNLMLGAYVFLTWFAMVLGPPLIGAGRFMQSEAYYFMRLGGTLIIIFLGIFSTYSYLQGSRTNMFVLIFIAAFYFCIYYYVTYRLWEVRQRPKATTQIEYTLTDGTNFKTNDSLVFIGKTNDYLFLYHNTTDTETFGTSIIPTSEVKKLKVTQYVRWARWP